MTPCCINTPMTHNRRLKQFLVAPEFLLTMGRGKFEVVDNPLPDDAYCVAAGYDPQNHVLYMTVYSDTYPVIPDGGLIPRLLGIGVKRIDD